MSPDTAQLESTENAQVQIMDAVHTLHIIGGITTVACVECAAPRSARASKARPDSVDRTVRRYRRGGLVAWLPGWTRARATEGVEQG